MPFRLTPQTMKAFLFVLLLNVVTFVQPVIGQPSDPSVMWDLSGRWRYQFDREDVGIAERWFERRLDQTLSTPVRCRARGSAIR